MTVATPLPFLHTATDLSAAQATLPIVELDRDIVRRPYRRVRPLPQPQKQLSISAWRLYQAAKKAELTRSFDAPEIDHRAACFAAEHHTMFRWNGGELRLAPGATDEYESAAHGSRSRLIGEGMLLLTMQEYGYAFWDRFDVLVKRALRNQIVQHPDSVRRAQAIRNKLQKRKLDKRSDFVIENGKAETAIAEAKGSLVSPGTDSRIKPDLRDALKQLAATKPLISPQPTKTYAVGTYLREVDDPHDDTSLIAFVDPDDREDADLAVALPPDWVRRGNYAAWLLGMGFAEAANALRNGIAREGVGVSLPVKRVGGRDFVYVVTGAQLRPDRAHRFTRDMLHEWWHWPEFWFGPWRDFVQLTVLGLRVDALAAISRAIVVPQEQSLLTVEPTTVVDTGAFDGSVMPDGSMCGAITVESIREIELREFTL
ncbi:MAG: hypothetical protein LC135_09605 [Phycisphaerae bacterium]|nr:hypothetical protein [Phycisphaerae bacterium]MCZ2400104.1 hypothetical protein [Phycisphaerae bacterium]